VAWSTALGLGLLVLGVMFHPGPMTTWVGGGQPFGIQGAGLVLDALLMLSAYSWRGVIGSMAALLVAFSRSAGNEREQIKWLVYAIGIYMALSVLTSLFAWLWPGFRWGMELSIVTTNLGNLGIAVAAMIAILRYRLYDIDLIINRTLVYTALTVGWLHCTGWWLARWGPVPAESNYFVSLLAIGWLAILLQPMRDGLQRLVNRLMYGKRDEPYAVLAGLSRRVGGRAAARGHPSGGGGDRGPGAQAALCWPSP